MGKLELYFDKNNWERFKNIYDEDWTETVEQLDLLNKLNNNLELAKVIWGRLGSSGIKWIYTPIPALNDLTPLECLYSEDSVRRLKEALMRMHT